MKPKSLAILLFLLFKNQYVCKAQTGIGQDTSTIIEANQKAWKLKTTDLEASKKLSIAAIQAAEKINYVRGLSYSFNVLGYYYKAKDLYDSARYYYKKSLVIREKLRDTLNIVRSYRNMMSVDKLQGNIKEAIAQGLMAMPLLTAIGNGSETLKELASLKTSLSTLYIETGNYTAAIRYALESEQISRELGDEDGLALAANCIGYVYEMQKQFGKALKQYEASIHYYTLLDNKRELGRAYCNVGNAYYHMNNNLLALANYNKGVNILFLNGFEDDYKDFLMNLGQLFEESGKLDSAFIYYKRLLDISIQSGNAEGQYEAHRSMGFLLNRKMENKSALQHLIKALIISEKSLALPEKILLVKEISNSYSSLGNNDSALYFANSYSSLNDSLQELLRKSMQFKHDLREKELELEKSAETNTTQLIIIIGISVAFLLLLIIFWLYGRSARAKKQEFILKEIIKEKELMAMDAMLEGQEEERKRLGAELHDTIGSTLSAAKYAFKAMENSLEKLLDENKQQYQKINMMLDEAMDSVRRISHNMAAGILTDKGLEGALADLCEMFEQSGKVKIELSVLGFDRKIEYITEINLYRIVQELMTNIIKHAHAQKIDIQLIKSRQNINLVVEDNGVGFNPQDPSLKRGIGILNIDNRVKKLGGTWNIDSGKGKGTTVIIDVPVNEEML